MREHLDQVFKADQCSQYVDEIGIAASNATELTRNIRAIFKCIRQAGLKLTIEKCHFGVKQIAWLGRTISSEGVSPQSHKIQKFPSKFRFTKSKKALQHYLGFVNYYKKLYSRMGDMLNPLHKLLKAEVPLNITSELKETFHSVNNALNDACQLALKQPVPGKQLVLMTDVSFRSAGHAQRIEDNPDQKIQPKRKTFAPIAFCSKIFSPAQHKMSSYSKKLLAIYMAFLEPVHILWEAARPTMVLRTKDPSHDSSRPKPFHHLCVTHVIMCCSSTLKKAHITGSDVFARLELKLTENIRLNIREDVQITPIEVTTSSSDVADEKHFFTQADGEDETEEQTLERKERSRKKATEWVTNEEPSSMKPSIKEFTRIDGNTTSYSIQGIKANARIRVEQDVDLALKNLKLKLLGQPYDEVLLTTDKRFKHYKVNEDRIILKDGLLMRKYYRETGNIKYYQILIPRQLVDEVL